MKYCPDHKVEIKIRDGKFGPFYSHKVGESDWCNKKPEEVLDELPNGQAHEEASEVKAAQQVFFSDSKDRRISRMHAQEMAIRYLDLQMKKDVAVETSLEMVKKLTDHFLRDCDS